MNNISGGEVQTELRDKNKRDRKNIHGSKWCYLPQTFPDMVWWWGRGLPSVGAYVSPFVSEGGLIWLCQGHTRIPIRADTGQSSPDPFSWAHSSVLASQAWNGRWKHHGYFFRL